MRFSFILAFILAVASVIFALQNPGYTELQFGPYKMTASTALIILCAVGVGILVGSMAMLPGRMKQRKETKHLKQTIKDLSRAGQPEEGLAQMEHESQL